MVGPILSGFIISRLEKFTGYSIVFGLSLLLFSIAVFLSFSLKDVRLMAGTASLGYCRNGKIIGIGSWSLVLTFSRDTRGHIHVHHFDYRFHPDGQWTCLRELWSVKFGHIIRCVFFASRYIKQPMRKRRYLLEESCCMQESYWLHLISHSGSFSFMGQLSQPLILFFWSLIYHWPMIL